jgi:epoxyqueuosine reductase
MALTGLSHAIKAKAAGLGFSLSGIARLTDSEHAAFYRAWIAAGRHGDMSYLARADAVERRTEPTQHWPDLKSAIVVTHNYYNSEGDDVSADPARGVIARYARGADYHKVMKKKLLALLEWLKRETGQELNAARAYVDTGPVLERELAQRAGIGWFGRNTMLLNPRVGSYFFLGTLLVELDLETDVPFIQDHCGTCSACVQACPTGALLGRDETGAPVIDAPRCISYLTIENRGPIPHELRALIGNRIYGCDICQEVCPWNGPKFVQLTSERAYATRTGGSALNEGSADTNGQSLIALMGMSEDAWEQFSRGSAMRRAKRAGFLRNVAVALGNWGSADAVPVLSASLDDPEPLVRGHAAWALGRIGSPGTTEVLRHRLSRELDLEVRDEIERVLGVEAPVLENVG